MRRTTYVLAQNAAIVEKQVEALLLGQEARGTLFDTREAREIQVDVDDLARQAFFLELCDGGVGALLAAAR